MKRTDELLLVYPGQGKSVRKWILSQLDGLAGTFDAPELFAFLLSQTQDDEPQVRNQALFSLQMFLPAYVRARHAGPALVPPADPDAVRLAALEAARPLARALATVAAQESRATRTLARLGLAQFPLPEVQGELLAAFALDPSDFEPLLAYARATGEGEMERPLVELMKQHHQAEPDLLLLVAAASGDVAAQAVQALAGATNALGRQNLAIALSKVSGGDLRAAAAALLSLGEGWVAVHTLAALEAARDPAAMAMVAALYRHPTELVRLEAVRVAGALGGPEAAALCLDAARGGTPRLQAQALDSLVHMKVEPQCVNELAGQLLASPSPTARLSAVLAIEDPADARVSKVLSKMVLSSEPHERLLAAFALAYRHGPGYFKYLAALATRDPCVPVRAQATKSLAKYPLALALPVLSTLLTDADPRIASAAGLALTRYTGAEAQELGLTCLTAIATTRHSATRARLFRLAGHLATRLDFEEAEEILVAGLADPEADVLCGALDGLKQLGRTPSGISVQTRLAELSRHVNPAIAARASAVALYFGRSDGVGAFAHGLATAEEAGLPTWLQQSLDVALSMTEALSAGAFPALQAALAARPAPPTPPVALASGVVRAPTGRAGLATAPTLSVEQSHVVRSITIEPAESMVGRLADHLQQLKGEEGQESSLRLSMRQDSAHLREAPSGIVNMPLVDRPKSLRPRGAPGSGKTEAPPGASASGPVSTQPKPAAGPRFSIPPQLYRVFGAVAGVGLLIAGLLFLKPARDPNDSGLSITDVTASPAPGTPPLPTGPVRPGTRIVTGKGGHVSLKGRQGTVIELLEGTVAEVGVPASDGDVSLSLTSGRLEAQIKGDQLQVPHHGHMVEALAGSVRLTIDGEKIRVLNVKGEVHVRLKNDEVLMLRVGEAVAVK